MKVNKIYEVTKKIKLHTKPLYEAEITQRGEFLKETKKYLIFSGFKVNKEKIIAIKAF